MISDNDFMAALNRLNPEQKQAVQTTDGPVLVLSGAGTGKTTVLTTRLAYIIKTGKALPFQCLAVTFTNKAAREMEERLAHFVGNDAQNIWLGTFHRIGLKILRSHAAKVGLANDFTVLDASDQERLVKQIMTAEKIDLKETPPDMILGQIQRLKDQGLTPDKAFDSPLPVNRLTYRLYGLYQERLKAMNAADFGDLLLYCIELFRNDPDLLRAFKNKFRYILVDEYQDTNVAQYLWLRLLTNERYNNICCVGDDDQSIYSWRGAEIGNILRFESDHPDAKVIRLESNYRSTGHILGAASALISHNEHRLDKTLRVAPGRDGDGDKIRLNGVWGGDDEAGFICDTIEREMRLGTSLKEIAVLVRASFQTRAIETQLLNYGIAYKVIGGMRFYEREEIRDAIAYARLLVQPKDDMAFSRIANKPRRGIGEAAMQKIHAKARETGLSLTQSAEILLGEGAFKGAAKAGLESLFDLMEKLRAASEEREVWETMKAVLEDSGYMNMWQTDKSPEAPGKVENLKELIGDLKERFATFEEFLEYVSLVTDNDSAADSGDFVSVMTLHAAKGLEFDVVFLPGWEEELFPHKKALDEGGSKALEEERRLAYVGITRARKKVFISYAGERRIYNQWMNCLPSRFISELPPEHIEPSGNAAAFGEPRYGDFGYASPEYGESHRSSARRHFARGYDYEEEDPEDSYDRFQRRDRYSSSRFRDDEYGDGAYPSDKGYTNGEYSYKNKRRERRSGGFFTQRKNAFPAGADVYHPSFGHGKVVEADGESVRVMFDEAGLKKVMADYLEYA